MQQVLWTCSSIKQVPQIKLSRNTSDEQNQFNKEKNQCTCFNKIKYQ